MTDNSDVYVAAKRLIATIDACFLFQDQLAVVKTFLLDLHKQLKSGSDAKFPYVHTITLLLKKLTYFLNVNFVVKERAPKELPLLRKLRSLLAINDLSIEFQGFYRELQVIITKPDIKMKFKEDQLKSLFSNEEEKERINKDILNIKNEIAKLSFKSCFPKDDDIHNNLETIKNQYFSQIDQEITSFEAFESEEMTIFLKDIDQKLLIVNRNILMQILTTTKASKRLQKAITVNDLDFRGFDDDENELSERFKGVWGKFGFAEYTPHISNQQRKRNQAAGLSVMSSFPVLVQRVVVNELSDKEIVALGYNIRQFEMNSEEVAKAKSILKYYGHYRINDELYIVTQAVQMNLAELYQNKKNHVFTGREVIEIALQVSNALKYLHQNAQIHGDMRPESIFFTEQGFRGDIKLGHFSHGLEKEDELYGALESKRVAYKAPETLEDNTKYESSDIYSLSIILWNLLHPESLPYDYPNTSVDEISMDIIQAVKPLIKYEDHCKNLNQTQRLVPDDWTNITEMLQFMWNQEPSDRPSSYLCYDFFKLQKQSLGTTFPRTSVFVVKETSKRQKVEDPIEEEPPQLPPRANSLHSGQISLETDDPVVKGSKNFRPYNKPINRNAKLPRVKSRGRMELPLDINKLQAKHDSHTHTAQDKSEITNIYSSNVGLSQPKGVDGLSRDKVQQELELFRESLDLEGKDMDNFDLENEVQYCLTHGLVEFHHKMSKKYGRGLKRFEGDRVEITTLPKKKKNKNKPKKGDDEVVGLNSMVNHLKKEMKKKKRFSINRAPKDKLAAVNAGKGNLMKRVRSMRGPFKSKNLRKKSSLASAATADIPTEAIKKMGSKLSRNKDRRFSKESSDGPDV